MPRYNNRGKLRYYFASDLANPAAPTVADIGGAIPVHDVLRSTAGLMSNVDDIDAQDQGSTFEKTIPGGDKPDPSTWTLYSGDDDDDDEETTRAAFVEGGNGFVIVTLRGAGPTAGQPCSVFPVRVKSVNDNLNTNQEAATYVVAFSMTDTPFKNVLVAA